ncbi:hypothetical protein AB0D08_15560 [Kitasatospora sp. NPDC048540]|uniref:hypothetical protein n=1 Tax=Kitasatospora sp. NPDC048540 TaxID=3155634 RepID=UPI0034013E78
MIRLNRPLLRPADRPGPAAVPDPDLLREAGYGRDAAYQQLVERHRAAVRGYLGTCVADPPTADRLTGLTFTRAGQTVRRGDPGAGPWRVRLLATARTATLQEWRREPDAVPLTEGFRSWAAAGGAWPLDGSDRLTEAYRILPLPWQTVLWHGVVEQEDPRATAPITGLHPDQVGDLTDRALAGLRSTFTALHRRAVAHRPACTAALTALPTGPGRPAPDPAGAAHLTDCPLCGAAALDLADLPGRLRRQLPERLLGWWDEAARQRGREEAAAAAPDAQEGRPAPARRTFRLPDAHRRSKTELAAGSVLALVAALAAGFGGPPPAAPAAAGPPPSAAARLLPSRPGVTTPATTLIPASAFAAAEGTAPISATGRALTPAGWLRFDNVDFGATPKTFVRIRFDPRGAESAEILVRLDDPGTPPVAAARPAAPETRLTRAVTGLHNVYLFARCPSATACAEIEGFSFR